MQNGIQGSLIHPEQIPSATEAPLVSAPNLQYKQNLSRLVPSSDQPLYRHFLFSAQAQGSSQTVNTESGIPDYWFVYVLPTWSATPGQYGPVAVRIWQWNGVGGEPELALTGGGSARIPGRSEFLTLLVTLAGANLCNYGILAVRGSYTTDFFVNPGQA